MLFYISFWIKEKTFATLANRDIRDKTQNLKLVLPPYHIIQVNLVRIPLQLKDLASRIPENSPFTKRHGRLLNLVTSNTDEDMMKVLFQFFDPLHHCFTFPDYQLVPTLEAFSQLLRIPILNQLPFNGTERDPKPEEIAQALHLQTSDVTTNCGSPHLWDGFISKS